MSEKRITGAQAMVKCLELEKIKTIFGYPGAAICPFYDALADSSIEHILVRHEVNACHAASGYARITRKPAVCVATSGPGATNLITAIATAYMDSIPIVAITGQVNRDQIGRDVFQEADITGAAEPFVKHSFLIKNTDELPEAFAQAFYIAGTGRPGPVLIDVPFDVQREKIEFKYPEKVEIRSYKPSFSGNKLQIKRVAEAILSSEKPVICAGGGLFSSADAVEQMRILAETLDVPVAATMMGISVIPSNHRLYLGMIGMHGKNAPNKAVRDCDLLILLGARVGDRAAAAINERNNLKVIHIDIDPAEIGKNLPVTTPVVGDLGAVLKQVNEHLKPAEPKKNSAWTNELCTLREKDLCAKQEKPKKDTVNPRFLIERLSSALPKNSIIVADVGQNQIWTANNIQLDGGRFLTSGGMGTMGYSVPAAIGAKKANPTAEVIAVCGDGSFQMQFMELATMVQHGIAVKIIIMVNNRLGMVRELQKNRYNNKLTAVFLDGSPDFIKLVSAYGINGEYVTSEAEAEVAVKRFIKSKKSYVLQVNVDPEEKSVI